MKRILIATALALTAACNQQSGETPASSQTPPAATQSAAASDGGERFYGRERFTLVGTQTGAESGTYTEHVRDWGRNRAEIKDTTTRVGGFSSRVHARSVFSGADIATVDLETGAVTTTTNPMYTQVVEAMDGRDGVEIGREMLVRMGGRATGEHGNFAGQDCEYWEVQQLGSRSCVTPWGATLHQTTTFAGVTMARTVTEVRLGDGGPDEAFQYDAARATAAPSLADIRAKMSGQ
jgi:hypothetical protein